MRRALAGYWTHAGYLNWDTGLGYLRWHQRKKVALAHGALIGIAAERELQPSPRWGRWAKWMLDRGLREYLALTDRDDRFPAALAYGVHSVPEPQRMAWLTAARYAANAMRALDAGLGKLPASEPPPLYSFDPDTGRLAVTTPAYNTAIIAANGGAHPYGGLDLARLFDAHQEVAANIGGTGRNAFGLHVRLAAHAVRRRAAPRSPLELVRAPRGVGAKGAPARVRRPVHGSARARVRRRRRAARTGGVPLHGGGDRGPLERLRDRRARDGDLPELGERGRGDRHPARRLTGRPHTAGASAAPGALAARPQRALGLHAHPARRGARCG